MRLIENMEFPPQSLVQDKMYEHSLWYQGDEDALADYFSISKPQRFITNVQKNLFWSRQGHNTSQTIPIHIPLASDISSTCADLLFGDEPIIKIADAHSKNASATAKATQDELNTMLIETGFYAKLLEAVESASAVGGVFIKLAWDTDISQYPIPVIEQADNAYPEFKFGVLTGVNFVTVVRAEDQYSGTGAVFRLSERYSNDGSITYELYKGTATNLGKLIDINSIPETEGFEDVTTGIPMVLAAYVPNMLPNRLGRNLYLGRSDYLGIEPIFHSLDETYSSWMRDIYLAKGRIAVPSSYLRKNEPGKSKFDLDTMVYEKMSIDPTMSGNMIEPIQFEIRSEQYMATCLELITRAITSAGYSPQTFGLSINGAAESGTALNIRERKSFSTKVKKEAYWEPALRHIIKAMLRIYRTQLSGRVDSELDLTIEFSDGANNTLSELSTCLQALANAQAVSIETKVRILHKDWSDDEVAAEVEKIKDDLAIDVPPQVDIDSFGVEDGPEKDDVNERD